MTRSTGTAVVLTSAVLCGACGSSSESAVAPAAQSSPSPSYTAFSEQSYPLCGVALGPPYGQLRVIGPLANLLGSDATRGAPRPATVVYAHLGEFVLKVANGCDEGTDVRIEPPSAAEITARAPSADGRLAGVGIRAQVRNFRILGSGAVNFDQQVRLACPDSDSCPDDPRKDEGVVLVASSPLPVPWGRESSEDLVRE